MSDKLLLKPREAAEALGISEKSLWSHTHPRGSIPCLRLDSKGSGSVRYSRASLESWIAKSLEQQNTKTTNGHT